MDKNMKIIVVLSVIVVALIAGLAFMVFGNENSTDNATIPEGMQEYDFDSAFKMIVPKDARFLKEWSNDNETIELFKTVQYFDKNNGIAISYIDSPMITNEILGYLINETLDNKSNVSIVEEGNLIIGEKINITGKVGNNLENSDFKYVIIVKHGKELVSIQGNDKDSLKSMADSIDFGGVD